MKCFVPNQTILVFDSSSHPVPTVCIQKVPNFPQAPTAVPLLDRNAADSVAIEVRGMVVVITVATIPRRRLNYSTENIIEGGHEIE